MASLSVALLLRDMERVAAADRDTVDEAKRPDTLLSMGRCSE